MKYVGRRAARLLDFKITAVEHWAVYTSSDLKIERGYLQQRGDLL